MRDSRLRQGTPRDSPTWKQFRALHVPHEVVTTLQQWAESPETAAPLLRVVRDIVGSTAVHRARMKGAQWAAGLARDPHYTRTPERPGALTPIADIVERVVADLERLIDWEFTPPIKLQELDAKLRPTGRVVRVSRLDESVREAFTRARSALLDVRARLRQATRRPRGRKAQLVQPFRVSALSTRTERPARRRDLERLLRDELLRLHPDRATSPRAARRTAASMAHRILDAIL